MHKKLRTVAAALATTLAALAMFMGSAAADVTVAISPSLLEFAVDQGASFAQTITVSNEGADPAAISVQVSPYGQAPEHLSATDWFLASPDKFELEPGTTKDVNVYIQVPAEVEPGGRYATVFFRTSALSAGSSLSRFVGGTGVGAQIGSVFLLTVRGPDLKLEGELTKVVPVVVGPSRIGSRVEITNTGNVHLVPSGEVELKDAEGNVVGRFALPETTALLPGETKSFDGFALKVGVDAKVPRLMQKARNLWTFQYALHLIRNRGQPRFQVPQVLNLGPDLLDDRVLLCERRH